MYRQIKISTDSTQHVGRRIFEDVSQCGSVSDTGPFLKRMQLTGTACLESLNTRDDCRGGGGGTHRNPVKHIKLQLCVKFVTLVICCQVLRLHQA